MYVDNLVTEFYNVILKQKVLIFVNYDIDAICAAKILQAIFRYDSIVYTLIPVSTISDLIVAYNEHKQDVKYVVLINCGGTIDIVEILEPEEHVIFFVADSHRPTDVCNVYSSSQIRMLCKAGTDEEVPNFEDIFKDDDDDEDEENEIDDSDDDGNVESQASKRARLDEQTLMRRREKRLWEENRKRILFEYVQFSYYSRSSSILMYELSWQIHRDNIDLLWWGIVGVVEQFILGKVEILQYLNEIERISAHVGRLCPHVQDHGSDIASQSQSSNAGSTASRTSLRIDCEKDLQLALYRHWTIESSLRYTMLTAVALKLWAIKGEKRLQQLLAEMELPLAESRQQYSAMDLHLRKEFHSMMEKISVARNLEHVTYPSFTLIQGFRTKYQAADYVYSMLALLSNTSRSKTTSECFYEAMDCLSRSKKDLLDEGIEKSKKFLGYMFRHVQNSLDMRQIISAGPFLYYVIQEGTLNAKYYSNPDCLWVLANFVLKAYVASSRKSKTARLPLIASAPLEEGYCLIVGVPPVAETAPRSLFGKAFEQVAEKTGCSVALDYFDSTVMKIQTVDRPKIFDALTVLLS
ncbi:cell division control protein 45 homolog [Planococcus citri]|uniref:cell division control protein 45 homolog n=1 Tax=Planococcus citri TaxID=170843 RepID=UPI0031FA2BEB